MWHRIKHCRSRAKQGQAGIISWIVLFLAICLAATAFLEQAWGLGGVGARSGCDRGLGADSAFKIRLWSEIAITRRMALLAARSPGNIPVIQLMSDNYLNDIFIPIFTTEYQSICSWTYLYKNSKKTGIY